MKTPICISHISLSQKFGLCCNGWMSLEFVSGLLDLLLLWLDWNVRCELKTFLLLPGACWWKCRAAGRASDCHVLWQTQHAHECAERKVGIRPLWYQDLHWDKRRDSSVLPGSKCCLVNNCSGCSFKSLSAGMCWRAQSVGIFPFFSWLLLLHCLLVLFEEVLSSAC